MYSSAQCVYTHGFVKCEMNLILLIHVISLLLSNMVDINKFILMHFKLVRSQGLNSKILNILKLQI